MRNGILLFAFVFLGSGILNGQGGDTSFWDELDESPLPLSYHGSIHQMFVDDQIEKLSPEQKQRLGRLWQAKREIHPEMPNPGASFVKILMFIAEGGTFTQDQLIQKTKPKSWFRQSYRVKKAPTFTYQQNELSKVGYPTLLSPHSNPIVAHGNHLYVVNTPSDTVDVIDAIGFQILKRIPVGIDPVSIQVRPDGKEIWVSNHTSDTVSVIDNDPESKYYHLVIHTVQDVDIEKKSTRFDEPSGIAFASNEKAYVALSSSNRIAIIDVSARKVVSHLPILSQEPRSIVVNKDRLYVIPFESNNQTQLSGGKKKDIDGHLVTFDAQEMASSFDSAGFVVDIIKHPDIPDRDLYIFDTTNDKLIQTVTSLGTLQYGLDVDSKGQVFIAHTDARNHINGKAGTQKHGLKELENRPYLNRVAKVSEEGEVTFFHLNPLPPQQPNRRDAIATPSSIKIVDDVLFMTAEGSDHLVILDLETGSVLSRIKVGSVPRGIAIFNDDDHRLAFVMNAIENSISVVDTTKISSTKIIKTIVLQDPTSWREKEGQKAFHTARSSSNGTFSCASCHPNGHTDHLLWVLDTPHIVGADQIEPRLSQTLRGLRGTAPYHWDGVPGDPYGGPNASTKEQLPPNSDVNSPVSSVRHLIDSAMASTMLQHGSSFTNNEGKAGYLGAKERDAMAEFLLNVSHKPSRARAYTDELSDSALTGLERFHVTGARDTKNLNTMVCGSCHTMPYLATDQESMNVPSFRGALDRFITQAQGRNSVISLGGVKSIAEKGWPEEEVWKRMLNMGEPRRLWPVIDMFKESSTGFSGAFARQVTIHSRTQDQMLTKDLLPSMEKAASEGSIVLRFHGRLNELNNSTKDIELTFHSKSQQYFDDNQTAWTYTELILAAKAGTLIGTFTGYHPIDTQSPQPGIWTIGSLHKQRGSQLFPRVYEGKTSMLISGIYIHKDASLFVNGMRVQGSISKQSGNSIEVTLDKLPGQGMNILQVQNPESYFSNDFIFYSETKDEAVTRYKKEPSYLLTAILNSAIINDNSEEALLVLEAGAELNAPHKHFRFERPPLILASLYGRKSLVAELLKRNADPNIADKNGITALHEAVRMGQSDICTMLLQAGAKINVKNKWKERPIDLTKRFYNKGHFEKYFAPYNVNLTLDHTNYLRAQPKILQLLNPQD